MLRAGLRPLPAVLALGAGSGTLADCRSLPPLRRGPQVLTPVSATIPRLPMAKTKKIKPSKKKLPRPETPKAARTQGGPAPSRRRRQTSDHGKTIQEIRTPRQHPRPQGGHKADRLQPGRGARDRQDRHGQGRVDRQGGEGRGQAVRARMAAALEKPAKPNHVKAASLADILGFNPKRTKAAEVIEDAQRAREVQALLQAPDRPAEAPDRGHRAPFRGDAQALGEGRRRRPLVLRPAHGRRRHRHLRPRLRAQPGLERAGGPLGDRGRHQAHPRRHLRHLRDHGQADLEGAAARRAVHPLLRGGPEADRAQPPPLPHPGRPVRRGARRAERSSGRRRGEE